MILFLFDFELFFPPESLIRTPCVLHKTGDCRWFTFLLGRALSSRRTVPSLSWTPDLSPPHQTRRKSPHDGVITWCSAASTLKGALVSWEFSTRTLEDTGDGIGQFRQTEAEQCDNWKMASTALCGPRQLGTEMRELIMGIKLNEAVDTVDANNFICSLFLLL